MRLIYRFDGHLIPVKVIETASRMAFVTNKKSGSYRVLDPSDGHAFARDMLRISHQEGEMGLREIQLSQEVLADCMNMKLFDFVPTEGEVITPSAEPEWLNPPDLPRSMFEMEKAALEFIAAHTGFPPPVKSTLYPDGVSNIKPLQNKVSSTVRTPLKAPFFGTIENPRMRSVEEWCDELASWPSDTLRNLLIAAWQMLARRKDAAVTRDHVPGTEFVYLGLQVLAAYAREEELAPAREGVTPLVTAYMRVRFEDEAGLAMDEVAGLDLENARLRAELQKSHDQNETLRNALRRKRSKEQAQNLDDPTGDDIAADA